MLELIEVGDPSGVDVVKFMLKDYYLQIGCINGLREFEDDLERVYKVKDYFAVKELTNTVNRKLKVYCMSADGSSIDSEKFLEQLFETRDPSTIDTVKYALKEYFLKGRSLSSFEYDLIYKRNVGGRDAIAMRDMLNKKLQEFCKK